MGNMRRFERSAKMGKSDKGGALSQWGRRFYELGYYYARVGASPSEVHGYQMKAGYAARKRRHSDRLTNKPFWCRQGLCVTYRTRSNGRGLEMVPRYFSNKVLD